MNRSKRSGQRTLAFSSLKHIQLIEPSVLFLLLPDILPNLPLVSTNRRNIIPPSPKILIGKVSCPAHEIPGYRNGALTLDKPYHLRDRILRWNQ